MDTIRQRRSPGSLVLEILIVLFTCLVILSIYYPKRLWDIQKREEEICQMHMENLNFAALFYQRMTGRHNSRLDDLLAFAQRESIAVYPPGFKIDRLTREDSGIDSFQVEYFDPYGQFSHYQRRMRVEEFREGRASGEYRVEISPEPLPQYPFVPVSRLVFTSSVPIRAAVDDRGVQGCFVLVGARGHIDINSLLGDTVKVPAHQYIYRLSEDQTPLSERLDHCPTTHQPYRTSLNVKLIQEAVVEVIGESRPPEQPLTENPLLFSNVIWRFLKDADAHARRILTDEKVFEVVEDSLLQSVYRHFLDSTAATFRSEGKELLAIAIYDSLLEENRPLPQDQKKEWERVRDAVYERMTITRTDAQFIALRDSLVNSRKNEIVEREFSQRLIELGRVKKTSIVESGTITTTSDSVEYYSQPSFIRDRLIKIHSDSITMAHLNLPNVQALFSLFRYYETYRVVKIDTIGITISCPIEGEFVPPKRSILDRIYSVGGAKHHGFVANGDISWSETR